VKMIECVDKDYVIVADHRLERPDWCSRSQWLEFWNIEELGESRRAMRYAHERMEKRSDD
jgi:hypothetical protein